jgi:hypothetical protein
VVVANALRNLILESTCPIVVSTEVISVLTGDFVSKSKAPTRIIFRMDRVEQLKKIQEEALELFTKKNADYGDAFAKYGVIGVLMRIEDKLQRSMSITKNGVNLVNDEGIRDTLIDLHNYAAMALMLLDEKPNA